VAFRKQIDTFNKGLALADPPVEPLTIPFESASLPAYIVPAVGHAKNVCPLLIPNGYDATITDIYSLPIVDPQRIALSGWCLGGHLAPRVASGGHRLAAWNADPSQRGIASGFRDYAIKLGAAPEAAANLGGLDQELREGAGDHWEMANRSLLNRRVFDWLDGYSSHVAMSKPIAATPVGHPHCRLCRSRLP
jgi:hypothetical protein